MLHTNTDALSCTPNPLLPYEIDFRIGNEHYRANYRSEKLVTLTRKVSSAYKFVAHLRCSFEPIEIAAALSEFEAHEIGD